MILKLVGNLVFESYSNVSAKGINFVGIYSTKPDLQWMTGFCLNIRLQRNNQMELKKIYSPNQIFGGSLWGGPIAAVYFLRSNYLELGDEEKAKKALSYGVLFILSIMAVLPFLPENFPGMVLPLAYCLVSKQLAITTQLDKEAIEESAEHTFVSSWKVFGIGTIALATLLIALIAFFIVLEDFGVINLA